MVKVEIPSFPCHEIVRREILRLNGGDVRRAVKRLLDIVSCFVAEIPKFHVEFVPRQIKFEPRTILPSLTKLD